jgi:hypothetical protein
VGMMRRKRKGNKGKLRMLVVNMFHMEASVPKMGLRFLNLCSY